MRLPWPPKEVNVLAENAASNLSGLVGEFVNSWRAVEDEMQNHGWNARHSPWPAFHEVLHQLKLKNAITLEQLERVSELRMMRNHVIHPTGITLSEEELRLAIEQVHALIRVLRENRS